MTSKRITTVLGQLGLTQVRYVSPVRRSAAQGLVGRVYEQVEREFGVLAPSLVLFSPAPQVLAASWLMLRETLLVARKVERVAKEAVATTVSLGNACPWCVTVHSTMLSGLAGGLVLADYPAEPVADPRLRAVTTWARDCRTEEGALLHEPACPAEEAPELIGTAVLFHYYNRMVNVFLTEVPLPPGAPRMALGPVMRILDRRMRPAAGRWYQPGTGPGHADPRPQDAACSRALVPAWHVAGTPASGVGTPRPLLGERRSCDRRCFRPRLCRR